MEKRDIFYCWCFVLLALMPLLSPYHWLAELTVNFSHLFLWIAIPLICMATWHKNLYFRLFQIPLDYVLFSNELTLQDYRVEENSLGSDHKPVIARLRLAP